MRCYFIRGGHIADVDKLADFSDEEAIAKAHARIRSFSPKTAPPSGRFIGLETRSGRGSPRG